jgi:hypothetical protein
MQGPFIQGMFREHAGTIHSGRIQGGFRDHSFRECSGSMQGTFRWRLSGLRYTTCMRKVLGAFRQHARNVQGIFR